MSELVPARPASRTVRSDVFDLPLVNFSVSDADSDSVHLMRAAVLPDRLPLTFVSAGAVLSAAHFGAGAGVSREAAGVVGGATVAVGVGVGSRSRSRSR